MFSSAVRTIHVVIKNPGMRKKFLFPLILQTSGTAPSYRLFTSQVLGELSEVKSDISEIKAARFGVELRMTNLISQEIHGLRREMDKKFDTVKMSGVVGLPAPKALLKNFSVEDVDEVFKSKLPEGARITSANAHGASFWTQTVRFDVVLFDGTETAYFLKVAKGGSGKGMLQGEYESTKLLHFFSPNGLPAPVAFGTYASDSDSHFYLCAFIDMTMRIPDPAKFCVILAEMHQSSIEHSPEGKYGFHVSTYQGKHQMLHISWPILIDPQLSSVCFVCRQYLMLKNLVRLIH